MRCGETNFASPPRRLLPPQAVPLPLGGRLSLAIASPINCNLSTSTEQLYLHFQLKKRQRNEFHLCRKLSYSFLFFFLVFSQHCNNQSSTPYFKKKQSNLSTESAVYRPIKCSTVSQTCVISSLVLSAKQIIPFLMPRSKKRLLSLSDSA